MSNFISFIGGTLIGAYIAQNYDIPCIKNTSTANAESASLY